MKKPNPNKQTNCKPKPPSKYKISKPTEKVLSLPDGHSCHHVPSIRIYPKHGGSSVAGKFWHWCTLAPVPQDMENLFLQWSLLR